MASDGLHPLASGMAKLLENRKYSDLKFVCGGQTFDVHKTIVCLTSPILAKECDGTFKESSSGVIEHSVFGFCAVDRMFQWMYTRDYKMELKILKDAAVPVPESPLGKIFAHIDVYAIADYYEIPDLQRLACEKFTEIANKIPTNEIAAVTRAVCANTCNAEDQLRQKLHALILTHIEQLIHDDNFMCAISEEDDFKGIAALICHHIVLTSVRQIIDLQNSRARAQSLLESNTKLQANLKQLSAEHKALQSDFRILKEHKKEEASALLSLRKSVVVTDTFKRQTSELERRSRAITECRHCDAEFDSYWECPYDDVWLLRCRLCRTRHFPI